MHEPDEKVDDEGELAVLKAPRGGDGGHMRGLGPRHAEPLDRLAGEDRDAPHLAVPLLPPAEEPRHKQHGEDDDNDDRGVRKVGERQEDDPIGEEEAEDDRLRLGEPRVQPPVEHALVVHIASVLGSRRRSTPQVPLPHPLLPSPRVVSEAVGGGGIGERRGVRKGVGAAAACRGGNRRRARAPHEL